MKRKQLGIFLLLFLALTSASGQTSGLPVSASRKNALKKSDLKMQFAQIAQKSGGRVGVTATILETGESVSLSGGERFPMQSVYKLPIGMAIFSRIDAGKIKLDQKVRIEKSDFLKFSVALSSEKYKDAIELPVEELLKLMAESDNTASDALLKLIGGSEAVIKYLDALKIKQVVVANYEREMHADSKLQYRNYATPQAAVKLLRALNERRGISPDSQARLLKFMIESPTGRKRLKALLPADAIVAHKTGTSGTRNNLTAATNDIGIITLPNGKHLAIAVFVADSAADETTRERTIAEITRAAWDFWSNK